MFLSVIMIIMVILTYILSRTNKANTDRSTMPVVPEPAALAPAELGTCEK